ncbi:MAG: hypothetical protein DSM106950_41895 [Stigonema ocellatum SAG 48.90 = DSM 106950]|nr:hypothetical protein [Stigonema ocellatum SAG 48.90 = DSM 106950]
MEPKEQQQALFWLAVLRIFASLFALAFTTVIYARLVQHYYTYSHPTKVMEVYHL